MKKYILQITINVHFEAKNEEHANDISANMGMTFSHPDSNENLEQSLVDWELKEVE